LPKFVRRYADLHGTGVAALKEFAADVRSGEFPAPQEVYGLCDEVAEELKLYGMG